MCDFLGTTLSVMMLERKSYNICKSEIFIRCDTNIKNKINMMLNNFMNMTFKC